MKGQPYLRKKGKKWIIEKKVDGKTKYIMTLPPLQEIIRRHADYKEIASQFDKGTQIKGAVNLYYANLKRKNKYDGFWKFIVCPTIKKIRGNKCEECDSVEHLQVHHMDSNMENINTLKLLCQKCHIELHKKQKPK